MNNLAFDLISKMPQLTALKSLDIALENTMANMPHLQKTIADLPKIDSDGKRQSTIVIGAGPSLHRNKPIEELLASGFDGSVICADGAMPFCLRNGLVPDYVVTLDPHPTRIVRWFGDPDLTEEEIAADDYYRRQDLDPHFLTDEMEKNEDAIKLIDQHAPRMKVIIAGCASQRVARRCINAGFDLYWWNPLYDDLNDPDSLTRKVYQMNKAPCMGTGGNTGSAAWVFANAVLGIKHIALIGMDLSYAPGTPLKRTQYYTELASLYGENVGEAYVDVLNPYTKETWITDPTYYWYRETLLEMAREADCFTYNCTQGGIVFGDGVNYMTLREFLDQRVKEERFS